MTLEVPLSLLFAHFLGDWLCQNDWMALGKSKKLLPLVTHTLVANMFLLPWGVRFALLNFLIHTCVDFCTSRGTTKLWFFRPYGESNMWWYIEGKRHWFFSLIGFDQFLHHTSFAITLYWLGVK